MVEGISSEKFVDVLQDIYKMMQAGFKETHDKIDTVNFVFNRKTSECEKRFSAIESRNALINGVSKVEKASEKEKKDLWKYVIRSGIVMMMGWTAYAFWKMIIANIDVIAK